MFADLLFAFVVALLLSLLFIPFAASRGRTNSVTAVALFFFFILFLATWAGGVWLTPVGPAVYGVQWLPFLLVGIIVALLLVAARDPMSGPELPRMSSESGSRSRPLEAEATAAATVFGILFWILALALAGAVAARYVID